METVLIPPANAYFFGIPTIVFSFLIPIAGLVVFSYIITMRGIPLLKAAPDNRWNRFGERFQNLLKIWLFQYRHPRYMLAGVLHITLFAGFLVLSIRSTSLVIIGISENFIFPGLRGPLGLVYNLFKDYAASLVLVSCVIAMIRRVIIKPVRYAVPEYPPHGYYI